MDDQASSEWEAVPDSDATWDIVVEDNDGAFRSVETFNVMPSYADLRVRLQKVGVSEVTLDQEKLTNRNTCALLSEVAASRKGAMHHRVLLRTVPASQGTNIIKIAEDVLLWKQRAEDAKAESMKWQDKTRNEEMQRKQAEAEARAEAEEAQRENMTLKEKAEKSEACIAQMHEQILKLQDRLAERKDYLANAEVAWRIQAEELKNRIRVLEAVREQLKLKVCVASITGTPNEGRVAFLFRNFREARRLSSEPNDARRLNSELKSSHLTFSTLSDPKVRYSFQLVLHPSGPSRDGSVGLYWSLQRGPNPHGLIWPPRGTITLSILADLQEDGKPGRVKSQDLHSNEGEQAWYGRHAPRKGRGSNHASRGVPSLLTRSEFERGSWTVGPSSDDLLVECKFTPAAPVQRTEECRMC